MHDAASAPSAREGRAPRTDGTVNERASSWAGSVKEAERQGEEGLLTRNPARVTSDVDHLKADFDALRDASAVLRDEFAQDRLITARARQNRT